MSCGSLGVPAPARALQPRGVQPPRGATCAAPASAADSQPRPLRHSLFAVGRACGPDKPLTATGAGLTRRPAHVGSAGAEGRDHVTLYGRDGTCTGIFNELQHPSFASAVVLRTSAPSVHTKAMPYSRARPFRRKRKTAPEGLRQMRISSER